MLIYAVSEMEAGGDAEEGEAREGSTEVRMMYA